MESTGTNQGNTSNISKRAINPKFLLPLGLTLVLLLALWANLFHLWREKLTDLLFTQNGSAEKNVVIVAIDEDSIQQIGSWPWRRSIFGQILGNLNNAKVIGFDINFKDYSRYDTTDDNLFKKALKESTVPVVLSSEMSNGVEIMPIFEFASEAATGYTNITVSPDNLVRYIPWETEGNQSFSLKIANTFDQSLAFNKENSSRVYYFGKSGTFPQFSFVDVLRGNASPAFFKDKIVLIGATASDLQDFRSTPVGILSGVEIQANAISTLLSQKFLHQNILVTSLFIILFIILSSLIIFKVQKTFTKFFLIFLIFVAYNLLVFLLFDSLILLDLFYPNLAIILASLLAFVLEHRGALKEKKFIRDSFSRYLSHNVVELLVKNPENLKLGGEKRLITVLFSDIRGFTTLSESMSPDDLVHFLNRYLTKMSDIIMEHNGLIDKYIGDAIMAFWGAPLENRNQSGNAVSAAQKMVEALKEFNEENKKQNLPEINIGIGINTGEATVGNLGSEKRFDYTAMGDTVNLSSRLESLTKQYEASVLLSISTVKKLKAENADLSPREIDCVRVKGKKEGVKIFDLQQNNEKFERALSDYYTSNWQEAKSGFENVLKENPADGVSKILLERVEEFIKNPPEDWDGVYTLKSK